MLQAFVIPAHARLHFHNSKSNKDLLMQLPLQRFFCVAKPAPFCVRRAGEHTKDRLKTENW